MAALTWLVVAAFPLLLASMVVANRTRSHTLARAALLLIPVAALGTTAAIVVMADRVARSASVPEAPAAPTAPDSPAAQDSPAESEVSSTDPGPAPEPPAEPPA